MNMEEKPKRIYRSRKRRMLAGVAGGIGEYLNVDATVIRIIFVLLAFLHGSGILIYLILAFIIPGEPEKPESGS